MKQVELSSKYYKRTEYLHTMQGDPSYISNGHSANLRVHLTSSDWLKVDFLIHGPVAADTSCSEKLLLNVRANSRND